jgi:hypothetical protein
MTTKSAKPRNGKKTDLKLKDLKANKDPRGGGTPNPRPAGLASNNHNEMFLADVS